MRPTISSKLLVVTLQRELTIYGRARHPKIALPCWDEKLLNEFD